MFNPCLCLLGLVVTGGTSCSVFSSCICAPSAQKSHSVSLSELAPSLEGLRQFYVRFLSESFPDGIGKIPSALLYHEAVTACCPCSLWRSSALGLPVPGVLFLECTPPRPSLATLVAHGSWGYLQLPQICATSSAGLGSGAGLPRKSEPSLPILINSLCKTRQTGLRYRKWIMTATWGHPK